MKSLSTGRADMPRGRDDEDDNNDAFDGYLARSSYRRDSRHPVSSARAAGDRRSDRQSASVQQTGRFHPEAEFDGSDDAESLSDEYESEEDEEEQPPKSHNPDPRAARRKHDVEDGLSRAPGTVRMCHSMVTNVDMSSTSRPASSPPQGRKGGARSRGVDVQSSAEN